MPYTRGLTTPPPEDARPVRLTGQSPSKKRCCEDDPRELSEDVKEPHQKRKKSESPPSEQSTEKEVTESISSAPTLVREEPDVDTAMAGQSTSIQGKDRESRRIFSQAYILDFDGCAKVKQREERQRQLERNRTKQRGKKRMQRRPTKRQSNRRGD